MFGEIRNSVTGDLLAGIGKGVEMIPFGVEKTWIIEKKQQDGKYKFDTTEPVTPQNESAAQEYEVEGIGHRRIYTLNFWCLRPEQIVDKDSSPLPFVITFKMTSLRAGKVLFTLMFVENKEQKRSPAAKVVSLSANKTENDKGTYLVLSTEIVRDSKSHEERACLNVFRAMKQANYKIDDSDVEDTSTTQTTERKF